MSYKKKGGGQMFSKQLAGISDPEAEKEICETGFFH